MKTPPGLVITFNPSPDFFSNLDILCAQLDRVVLIDNGSKPEIHHLLEREASDRKTSLVVIFNETNLGVATALNQGFQWAIGEGYEQIIAFDQDSLPASGMVEELLRVYDAHPNRDRIAIVVPRVGDPSAGIDARYLRARGRFFFERVYCTGDVIDDVSIIITSGSLNNLGIYKKIGSFRDDFFVDYVDTEYCLRAIECGYKIVVACKARLQHRLGNQQMKRLGPLTLRPTHHSPLRWYYISRNRICMYRDYVFEFPHWALYDLIVASYALLKMLLLEDQKIRKILALFLGTLDGILKRTGPISASRLALISQERRER
jgi:rhamnosyltransferase